MGAAARRTDAPSGVAAGGVRRKGSAGPVVASRPMAHEHALVAEALPHYEIGSEIGRGASGIVRSATHRRLGRPVAIKQLPRAYGADPYVKARFLHEARVLAELNHPHVV